MVFFMIHTMDATAAIAPPMNRPTMADSGFSRSSFDAFHSVYSEIATTTKPPMATNWIISDAPVCAAVLRLLATSEIFLPLDVSLVRSVVGSVDVCASAVPAIALVAMTMASAFSHMADTDFLTLLMKWFIYYFLFARVVGTAVLRQKKRGATRLRVTGILNAVGDEHADNVESCGAVQDVGEPLEIPSDDAADHPYKSDSQAGLGFSLRDVIDRHPALDHGGKSDDLKQTQNGRQSGQTLLVKRAVCRGV